MPLGDISDDCNCKKCGAGAKRDELGEEAFAKLLKEKLGSTWIGVKAGDDRKYIELVGHTEWECEAKKCTCC